MFRSGILSRIRFLKRFQGSSKSSYQRKQRSILIALVFGVVGVVQGVIVLILAQSVTVFSDLLRNASLVFAIFLSWMAVRRATQGKNIQYNYGLGKLENLSSLIVAIVMIISIATIVYQIVLRFNHPQFIKETGAMLGIVTSLLAAACNMWVWITSKRVADKEHSPVMDSLWRLYRVKAISNFCVVGSLGLSVIFIKYAWSMHIDTVGSIVLLGFLLYATWGVITSSIFDLLDRALDESLQIVILRELAIYFDSYEAIHGIRSRRSGGNVYIEIFLEFGGEQKMSEVHNIIANMKTDLEKSIPASQVLIVPSMAPVF